MVALDIIVISCITVWRWCRLTTLSSLLLQSEDDLAWQQCQHFSFGLRMMALDIIVISCITVWRWCRLTTLSSLLLQSEDDVAWQQCHHFYFGLEVMELDNTVITFTAVWRCWSLTTLSSLLVRSEDDVASKQQLSLLAGCSSSIGMHMLSSTIFRTNFQVVFKCSTQEIIPVSCYSKFVIYEWLQHGDKSWYV
jgi:hypothetical protein